MDYIQYILIPDKNKLALLLNECKGPDRTMSQFAKSTGLNPSVLSRIQTGHFKKPLSEKTLRAIFENKDPECGVSMDALYRANGMLPLEECGNVPQASNIRKHFTAIQETITNELLDRRYTVKADFPNLTGKLGYMEPGRDGASGDLPIPYDLGVSLSGTYDLPVWLFEIVSLVEQSRSSENMAQKEKEAREQIRTRNCVFLVDIWQPERLEGVKVSWVFAVPHLYDMFKEQMREAKLNTEMSVILVDLKKKVVVKEEPIGSSSLKAHLFDAEKIDWQVLRAEKHALWR